MEGEGECLQTEDNNGYFMPPFLRTHNLWRKPCVETKRKIIANYLRNPHIYFFNLAQDYITQYGQVVCIHLSFPERIASCWRPSKDFRRTQLTTQQERQYTYKRNIEVRSRNHTCRGKTVSITYSVCVSVALVIQHATRMRGIILSSVACLAVPCFSTLSHER
jgi:hypothetical protein